VSGISDGRGDILFTVETRNGDERENFLKMHKDTLKSAREGAAYAI
jgi:hypothetical protein